LASKPQQVGLLENRQFFPTTDYLFDAVVRVDAMGVSSRSLERIN